MRVEARFQPGCAVETALEADQVAKRRVGVGAPSIDRFRKHGAIAVEDAPTHAGTDRHRECTPAPQRSAFGGVWFSNAGGWLLRRAGLSQCRHSTPGCFRLRRLIANQVQPDGGKAENCDQHQSAQGAGGCVALVSHHATHRQRDQPESGQEMQSPEVGVGKEQTAADHDDAQNASDPGYDGANPIRHSRTEN